MFNFSRIVLSNLAVIDINIPRIPTIVVDKFVDNTFAKKNVTVVVQLSSKLTHIISDIIFMNAID